MAASASPLAAPDEMETETFLAEMMSQRFSNGATKDDMLHFLETVGSKAFRTDVVRMREQLVHLDDENSADGSGPGRAGRSETMDDDDDEDFVGETPRRKSSFERQFSQSISIVQALARMQTLARMLANARLRAHACACAPARLRTHAYARAHASTHACACVRARAHVRTRAYTRMHAYAPAPCSTFCSMFVLTIAPTAAVTDTVTAATGWVTADW